jgi:hypothetical protein
MKYLKVTFNKYDDPSNFAEYVSGPFSDMDADNIAHDMLTKREDVASVIIGTKQEFSAYFDEETSDASPQ